MIDRRQFLIGAACAAAATALPTTETAQAWIDPATVERAIVPPLSWGQRWVTHEAIENGMWDGIKYVVTAEHPQLDMCLISWRRPQPLQRSRSITTLHPHTQGRQPSSHAGITAISQ